ncbi:MAG: hypothetical protein HY280_03455, partial [Nitrospinae bacterium]|nr:hypothetical protein [Nitrospinota bacterium]
VLNMEEKLGYVHKGIEKRFESLGWPKMARLAGRVSGDSTVAHALGFCMAFEKLSGAKSAERANWIRALLLERERMANHLADLAAITNDTSFTFCFYQFWNLRERMLRTNQKLFGHRLLMDVVTPGGVANDLDHGGVSAILEEFKFILPEFERIAEIFDGRPSLKDRLYNTGVLLPAVAENLGLVGFAGRASGRDLDARKQWLFSPYDVVAPNTHVLHSGDVHARAWMRIEEFRDSARMIKEFLGLMPKGAVVTPPLAPPPNTAGFSAVEGWRGEIIYWLKTAPDGSLGRCMVRDPSNVNWLALEQSVKADMVPDFPVNNKSWNNSYSGNDL